MHILDLFFTSNLNNDHVAGGLWTVLIIPGIIAFVFGVWVFYNIIIDVSERETVSDRMNKCIEGCESTPGDLHK